jgi:hypothetical protein
MTKLESPSAVMRAHLETILSGLGHDPSKVAAGWRSDDPFVVASLFAAQGYPVFPCSKTKSPLTRNGLYAATCDLRTLCGWERFNKQDGVDRYVPVDGWCVRTGRYECETGTDGLWILDIDDAAGYARLAELEDVLGPLPKSWTNMSGRLGGGEHRLFAPTNDGPDLKSVGKALIFGERGKIDQKGRGGYAVIAGSYHSSGKRYHWADGCAPDEIVLASLPPQWVEAIDKADVGPAPSKPTIRSCNPQRNRREHDQSILVGDGKGYGGFDTPVYKNAIRYFLNAGIEAPAEPILEVLREIITEAPKDHGRDVSRYMSGSDLPRIVERARAFVNEVKESESDEYDYN